MSGWAIKKHPISTLATNTDDRKNYMNNARRYPYATYISINSSNKNTFFSSNIKYVKTPSISTMFHSTVPAGSSMLDQKEGLGEEEGAVDAQVHTNTEVDYNFLPKSDHPPLTQEEAVTKTVGIVGKNIDETDSKPKTFKSEKQISPLIRKALDKIFKISTMTDIQEESLQPILDGHDVIARSRTGTGKTIAYMIPAIERTHVEPINKNSSNKKERQSEMVTLENTMR